MPNTRTKRTRNASPNTEHTDIVTRKPRGRPKSVVTVDTARLPTTKVRSSRNAERRESQPKKGKANDENVSKQNNQDGNDQIVAAIAGLQAKMTERIDTFAEGLTARMEVLERTGARRRSTRSLSSEAQTRQPRRPSTNGSTPDQSSPRRRRSVSERDRRQNRGRDDGYDITKRNREFIPYTTTHGPHTTPGLIDMTVTTPFYDILSPKPDTEKQRTEAVNELLVAAGTELGKKRGNTIVAPHRYVIRGNKNEKISMEEATWAEYFAALCRMMKDRSIPASWLDPLREHMHQLATMATKWDWHTCRQWSELVFTMIADGSLPFGWADQYALKDVQRDVCLTGTRLNKQKYATHNTHNDHKNDNAYNTQTKHTKSEPHRNEYSKDTDGKPCYQWNWGIECGHTTSHGLQPDRKCHLCAWCAVKYAKANGHQEKVCQNKRRFLERKNNTDKTERSQDFH